MDMRLALAAVILLATFSIPTLPAQNAAPVDPKTIPVIDGAIGPCSADFTVNDASVRQSTPPKSASTSPTDS